MATKIPVAATLLAVLLCAAVVAQDFDYDAGSQQWDEPVVATPAGFSRATVQDDCGYCSDCDCSCDAGNSADPCDSPWSFTFTQTAGFGTGLALPIALTPSNTIFAPFEDDFEFLTNSTLRREFVIDDVTTFTTGLGYYQNVHPELDEIDLQVPSATAQLARQIGERTVAALDYSYSYYFLSGSSFVSQHRIDLSTLRRVNDQWDWKVTSGYAAADFRPTPILDSDNYSARGELIRYLDSERSDYLTFGYAWGHSDAAFDGFSYDVNSFFAGGRWGLGSRGLYYLAITGVYAEYDFEDLDLFEPTVIRGDELVTVNTTVSRYITDYWTSFVSYSYLNSDSNVFRQNYHTNLTAIGVTYAR